MEGFSSLFQKGINERFPVRDEFEPLKRKRGTTFRSFPAKYCRKGIGLELIKQLQPKSRLALIRNIGGACRGIADTKDFSIAKILPQLDPAQ